MQITIVTGNEGKLRELEALAAGELTFRKQKVDLDEIQTLDLRKLTEDKARRAYAIVGSPVIVEDSGAELASLGGLPGPFAKFFEETLGVGALYKLTKVENDPVTIRCTAAYFDGTRIIFGEGSVSGVIVPPRGTNGFGFDPVVQPIGSNKTMAEMTREEKNAISHRGQAFRDLLSKLRSA